MTRVTPALLTPLACALIAACQPHAPGNAAEDAANAIEPVDEGNAAETDVPRSILRPSILPEPTPTAAPAKPLEAVISFAAASGLDDAARARLDALAESAEIKAGGAIILRGHTDSRGNDAGNRMVSKRRAQAVADYLVTRGVAADRMAVIGLGEDRPIAPNANPDGSDDEAGRARNRRVELTIMPPAAEPVAPPAPDAVGQGEGM